LAGCYAGSKESAPDSMVLLGRRAPGETAWNTTVLRNEPDHAAGNVRLFRRPDGQLQIIYALNFGRWCRGGSRLFQQVSADAGQTWSEPEPIPCDPPLLGKNAPVDLPNGRLVLPVTVEGDQYSAAALVSTDGGDTWQPSEPIAAEDGTRVLQPAGALLSDGTLLFLLRSNGGRLYRSTSNDGGTTWSVPEPTDLPNNNSGIDLVRTTDGRLLLVYNPVGTDWGPRSPLTVMHATDDGRQWQELLTLEDGLGEYSYPTAIQTDDGLVHVTYTYLRERIKHVALALDKA
jgi:photosystem II stability/assembly factor-like uncharacterized protein